MKCADNCLVSRAPKPGSYMAKMGLTMPTWSDELHGIRSDSWIVKYLDEMYETMAKTLFEAQSDMVFLTNGIITAEEIAESRYSVNTKVMKLDSHDLVLDENNDLKPVFGTFSASGKAGGR